MIRSQLGVTIQVSSGDQAGELRDGLVELLVDAVKAGATIGFLEAVSRDEAIEYWERVFAEVEFGRRLLIVAKNGEHVLGAIQLSLAQLPNGKHRGEVERLLVHTAARRQGLGTALMMAAEDAALARGRHLLLLDTRAGDPAGKLYEKLGYIRAGVIPGYALSPSGHLHGSAIYYRDLRDSDAQMLGENDAPTRDFP